MKDATISSEKPARGYSANNESDSDVGCLRISRRKFLIQAGMVGTGVACLGAQALAQPPQDPAEMILQQGGAGEPGPQQAPDEQSESEYLKQRQEYQKTTGGNLEGTKGPKAPSSADVGEGDIPMREDGRGDLGYRLRRSPPGRRGVRQRSDGHCPPGYGLRH
jgi:hypothetical protein